MESKQKPSTQAAREEDVDLGQLFNQTGGVINNFFNWLGRAFNNIGTWILLLLFFLKRNFLWLVIGAIAGVAYGFIIFSKTGVSYHSEMAVKANFHSTRNLYGDVDFFNALISNRQISQLQSIFSLTPEEARSLVWFEVSPIVSEVIAADIYKEKFLSLYHNTQVRMDTFWIKTITYKDFKNSLTKYDYPLQEVRVISNNPFVFPKIQAGLVKYIARNQLITQVQQNEREMNIQEVELLETALQSLDSLRQAYYRRLISSNPNTNPGNNLTMVEGSLLMNPPELEVYNKVLQLKDELKMVKNESVIEKDILEVYSPFGAVGTREGFLQQKMVRFGLYGLALAFIITALFGMYKTLTALEMKYSREKQQKSEL